MNYFKNEGGAVYAYDDSQVAMGIVLSGLTPMTPEEVQTHLNPALTDDQVKQRISSEVQRHLDSTAQSLGYDSMAFAVTYAEEPSVPKFQTEGQALRAWRSLVWARCYELWEEFVLGARGRMTPEEVIEELPTFVLPTIL